MHAPDLIGRIERRVLLDFTVDPVVAARHLPPGFAPRLHQGTAVVGVCLIRLVDMRPAGLPAAVGCTVEAAAHRISVVHRTSGGLVPGVYVPRRDTSSRLGVVAGGRVWPGVHGRASFAIDRSLGGLSVDVACRDGAAVSVGLDLTSSAGHRRGRELPDPAATSAFHAEEERAWSPGRRGSVEPADLSVCGWAATTVAVTHAASSWLDDTAAFAKGSATLAGALLLEDLVVRWRAGRGGGQVVDPARVSGGLRPATAV